MEKPEEQKSTSTTTSTTKPTTKPKPEAEEVFVRKKEVSTSGNPYKLATFLLAVLVFGLTAGVIYLEFFATRSPKKDPESSEECSEECKEYIYVDDDNEENNIPISSRDLIAEAKTDRQVREIIQKLYNELKEYGEEKPSEGNGVLRSQIDKQFNTSFPSIYLDDHKTLTALNRSYDLRINAPNQTPAHTYTKLMEGGFTQKTQDILASNNFQQYSTMRGATGYRNDQTGIICNVTGAGMPFIVTCANENWIDPEVKKLNSDLAAAYFDKTSRHFEQISATPSQIQNSGSENYQRLKTNADDGFQLFYRKNPDDAWIYFAGGQSPLPCSDYNTDDLKRTFMGEPCVINSTVNTNPDIDTVKP